MMVRRNDADAEPMVARDATYHRAPDALRAKLRAALARESAQSRPAARLRWLGFAGAIAASCLLGWNLALRHAAPDADELVARDAVAAHVRSLMAPNHLNDVASSDQHAVKPWFAGKLDFAPPVQDLANAGYPLLGGRLDYLNGRAVAALTYGYRKHVVNVFVWPAGGEAAPVESARQGYSLLRWKRGGMEYVAVSDAGPGQLAPLAAALP
jgi:anti-sigma factor RsiW